MFKKKIYIFLTTFLILITGCATDNNKVKKPEKVPPLDILYKSAYTYYLDGDFSSAIELFKRVENRYSYTEWAPKATLMIMFMYYETGQSYQTLEYAKKYKKNFPASKNIKYVTFIEAMTFYEQINFVSRDQTYTKAALKKFQEILDKYPSSIYSEESKLKIDLINEQLAGKEIYLARYYMKKSKWIAAIKRLNTIVNEYPSTIYTEEALHRLVEIYYKLGNLKQAKKYASILGYNFNSGDWYKRTYKIVKNKNYSPTSNTTAKRKIRDKIKNLLKFK